MTDPTFETLLTGQLRAYAAAGVRPIDRVAIAEGTIALQRTRRIRLSWPLGQSRRPLALVIVGLLIAALLASAALVGSRLLTSVETEGSYEAIFLRYADESERDLDIVAVASGGQERLVPSVTEEGRTFRPNGSVSQDGWIAVYVDRLDSPRGFRGAGAGEWALADLANPDRSPRFVRYQPVIGGAWGPGGLFATTIPDSLQGFSIQVVDAGTGSTTLMPNMPLPGGGPDLIWAANGSGLLVTSGDGYGIAPLDGGAVVPRVPALAPRPGARWIAPGGSTLFVCAAGSCSARPDGFVSTIADDGTAVQWYDGQVDGAMVRDASFAADGRSVWILLEQVDGTDHIGVIATADEPGNVRVVATVNLGPGVAHMGFGGLAPDDSSVAIRHWLGELGGTMTEGPTTLISRSGHATSVARGNFIGFMPSPAVGTE